MSNTARFTFPPISILIPTKNGGKLLNEVLAMVSLQTVDITEILVADSASDDDTREIAAKYGAEIIEIDPKNFDHGGTRTLLCRRAKGEILVFLTQDAIPKRRDSIEQLIKPLLENDDIAASYGRQLPSFDADHFAESLRTFNYPPEKKYYSIKDKEKVGLKAVFTSNSFAGYRRSALAEVGFFQDGLIFGEDTVAVGRLLLKNYTNVYAANAPVYHSHNNSPLDDFKRYFDIGVLHTQEKWLLETYGSVSGQGRKYISHELHTIHKKKHYSLLPELFIRITMKYCGYKIGRYYKILPMQIVTAFSMHSNWWLKHNTSDDI